jgi:hypothetical protein
MAFKVWIIAAIAAVLGGIAATIGQWYVPPKPRIEVQFKDNACAIRCPAQTAYASQQAAVTCTAGTAPLCQCTDAAKQQARCVPVN